MPVAVRMDAEELYDALRLAGVAETPARLATASVVSVKTLEYLVSKDDLQLAKDDLLLALAKQTNDMTLRFAAIVLGGLTVCTTVLGLLITFKA